MSSPKSATRSKASKKAKTFSGTVSSPSPRKPHSSSLFLNSKVAMIQQIEKIYKTNALAVSQPAHYKDSSDSVRDSLSDAKTGLTSRNSQIKSVDEQYQKLLEELASLKQNLQEKDTVIKKLTQENSTLQRQMEELQTTIQDAKAKISARLKRDCQKIKELEGEIGNLRNENQIYLQKLVKISTNLGNKASIEDIDDDLTKYYCNVQQKMDNFYQKLNQQIQEFMSSSKLQYESLNGSIQSKILRSMDAGPSPSIQAEALGQIKKRLKILDLKQGSPLSQRRGKLSSSSFRMSPSTVMDSNRMTLRRRGTLEETSLSERSDQNWYGFKTPSASSALRKLTSNSNSSPKSSKLKVTFRTDTFRSDEEDK